LERVIGTTACSNASLDVNPITGELAYPAGCVCITYDPQSGLQTRFLSALPLSTSKLKPIICVAFRNDGKKLATSEYGHQASIFVWSIDTGILSHELKSHSLGVSVMAFTPNNKHLISVGSEHDQQLNIWDMRSSSPLRSCKITSKVRSLAVSEDSSFFVTAGLRHLKIWNLELSGHSVTCGNFKDHEFVDVACGKGSFQNLIYTISREGVLFAVEVKSRSISFWLDLKTRASALSLVDDKIVVACAQGIVRVFSAATLDFIATLPKPNAIGKEFDDTKPSLKRSLRDSGPSTVYPDAIAVRCLPDRKRLACIYNNRAIFIWDISNLKQIGKYRSHLAHSSCIWGLDMLIDESSVRQSLEPQDQGTTTGLPQTAFPPGTFATCSADGSIRLWNIDHGGENIYSKDLLGSLSLSPAEEVYKGLLESGPVDGLGGSLVGSASNAMALTSGIRSIKLSPDGDEIASGDRSGNIRIHRLGDFGLVSLQEAHESEVLCLAYNADQRSYSSNQPLLLASGSRDRLIHIFARTDSRKPGISKPSSFSKANVRSETEEYQLVSTMDDHSASITGLAFSNDGAQLFSASADKSIIFRKISQDGQSVKRYYNMAMHGTIYDIKVAPGNRAITVSAGQDRKIYIHDTSSGALVKTIPSGQSDTEILKLEIDPTGLLLITASQDRMLRLYNLATGELLSTLAGHSEIITGVKFDSTGRRVISVSGDGCIFVWSISGDLMQAITARRRRLLSRRSSENETSASRSKSSHPASAPSSTRTGRPSTPNSPAATPPGSGKTARLSIGSSHEEQAFYELLISPTYLPHWAKPTAKSTGGALGQTMASAKECGWSHRVPSKGITIASRAEYVREHGSLVIQTDGSQPRRLSVDASMESTDLHQPVAWIHPQGPNTTPVATAAPSDETIYFDNDQDEPPIGIVVKSKMTGAPASNEEESFEEHTAFFESLANDDTDHLHQQSFANLNDAYVPTKSMIQGRKSISAKYFLKRPPIMQESSSSSSTTAPSDLTVESLNSKEETSDRREQMARDVERTKARLREMGISFGPRASPAPQRGSRSVFSAAGQALSNATTTSSPSSSVTTQNSSGLPPISTANALVPPTITTTTTTTTTSATMTTSPKPPGSPGKSFSMSDLPSIPLDTSPREEENADNTDNVDNTAHLVDNDSATEEELQEDEEDGDLDGDLENAEIAGRPGFLASLMGGFERTVEIYKELKESQQQDEMVLQFRSVFADMKATLDILSSEDSVLSSMASDRTYELTGSTTLECTEAAMLERYSEMLVGLVKTKLKGPNV
jgi:WD40 repeat protein